MEKAYRWPGVMHHHVLLYSCPDSSLMNSLEAAYHCSVQDAGLNFMEIIIYEKFVGHITAAWWYT